MRERLESGIAWRWAEAQTPEAIDEDERPTGRYKAAPAADWDETERPTRPDSACVGALAEQIAEAAAVEAELDGAFQRITHVG